MFYSLGRVCTTLKTPCNRSKSPCLLPTIRVRVDNIRFEVHDLRTRVLSRVYKTRKNTYRSSTNTPLRRPCSVLFHTRDRESKHTLLTRRRASRAVLRNTLPPPHVERDSLTRADVAVRSHHKRVRNERIRQCNIYTPAERYDLNRSSMSFVQ